MKRSSSGSFVSHIHLGGRNFRQNVWHENANESSSPKRDSRRRWQRKSLLADIENQGRRDFQQIARQENSQFLFPLVGGGLRLCANRTRPIQTFDSIIGKNEKSFCS